MAMRVTIAKRFVLFLFTAGIFLSAPAWATDIVGTVKKTSDSTTVIAGAKVVLVSGATRLDSTVSDSLGGFTFLNATAGTRQIQTSDSTYLTSNLTTTVNGAAAVDSVKVYLALAIPATITGTVSNAIDSSTLPNVWVYLRRSSATAAIIDSVTTDSVGVYKFINVAPGIPNYWLTVVATGFVNGTRTNLGVANGGTSTANFFLTTPGIITGIIRDASDSTTPVANALIVRRRGSATAAIIDSAYSNLLGVYTFTNVAPGTPNYWLTATQSNYLTATNANVVVVNGGSATTSNFYMSIAIAGSIQGLVLSSLDSLTPVVNGWVYLRRGSATAAVIDSTQTIESGGYAFGNVSPGTPNYWITAVAPNYVTTTRANLAMPNSSSITANLYLSTPSTLSGIITDSATGLPLSNATIILRRGSATSAAIDTTRTSTLGAYIFVDVAPGTPNYWLTASDSGYTSATVGNVSVVNGATGTIVNFNLMTPPVALASSAALENRIRFIRMGDQLVMELGASKAARNVVVYAVSGKKQWNIAVPSGASRVLIPSYLAPENGFLFRMK